MPTDSVLMVANVDVQSQYLDLKDLGNRGLFRFGQVKDLLTGESPALFNTRVVIPPLRFYWLTDQRPGAAF
jgi:amylosucrase